MTLPTFLLIGAAKAGTTLLYYYLKQHPQIYMPGSKIQKEPEFFALEREKLEFPGPRGTFKKKNRIVDLDSYRNLFADVITEIAIGEASTSYIYSHKAPQRIKHYIPNAKLIAILRDPVERAFSHYLFWASQGFEPDTDFDFSQAVREEPKRIRNGWSANWHYVEQGFYYVQLKRYLELFDSSQLKIYLFEDLTKDKLGLTQDIFRFLGVDDSFVPNFSKVYNQTQAPKNRTVNILFNRPNPIKTVLKPLFPHAICQKLANKVKVKEIILVS